MKKSTLFEGIFDQYLETDFELNLLKACHENLTQVGNDLRFNNYAYSLRELSRHLLNRLAPDENILKCVWYKNEIPGKVNGITRNQRIKYAIQGGLSDIFVEEELGLNFSDTKRNLKDAINLLSKFTHINKSTFAIKKEMIAEYVVEINNAFSGFFSEIEACRNEIISGIEASVDQALIERTVNDVVEDIDEMSTHHQIQSIDYYIKVKSLNESEIVFEVSGNIDVLQQYGSSRDRRSGDGHEMRNSFPYECELGYPVNKLTDFKPNIERLDVNTDSFYH